MELININNDRFLKQTLSFLAASFATVLIIFCLSFINNNLDIASIAANYNLNINDFIAEKSEKYQYILGTAAFPVFFILARLCLKSITIKEPQKYEKLTAWSGFVLIVLLVLVIVYKTMYILSLFLYLPNGSIDAITRIVALILFFAVLFTPLPFIKIYNNILNANHKILKSSAVKKKISNIVIYILAALNLVFIFYLYVTKTYYFNSGKTGFHFDAYFYPVYKVYCGQTPLIDFNSLYGFYPYFLVPLLKLTGGISMLRFSIIMSALMLIALLSITVVIFRFCRNKVLALLGTLSVTFIIAICPMLVEDQTYYLQYTPHRILFPALILLICFSAVKAGNYKTKTFITILGYVISTLSLLWNIDTGIVVLLVFALFQLYLILLKYTLLQKALYYSAIKIILFSILCATAAVLILFLITYSRTGEALTVTSILYSQISFYGLGFYMLKMPLLSPWLLLVILYAFFLARALGRIRFLSDSQSEERAEKSILYFIIPVIGMGIFSYYQGRSHILVFLAVIWPGILLLVFLLDEYLNNSNIMCERQKSVLNVKKLNFICVFILLASLAGNYIIHAAAPFELQTAKDKIHAVETTEISLLLQLYAQEKEPDENIDLVTLSSAAVYCINRDDKIANIPATIDWFTKDDYRRVLNYLMQTENKVIIDQYSMDLFLDYEPDGIGSVLTRFQLINERDGYRVYIPNE